MGSNDVDFSGRAGLLLLAWSPLPAASGFMSVSEHRKLPALVESCFPALPGPSSILHLWMDLSGRNLSTPRVDNMEQDINTTLLQVAVRVLEWFPA